MRFDISFIKFSRWDKARGIRVPLIASGELAEETAVHLGDGYMFYDYSDHSYRYGIGLHRGSEKDYLNYVANLVGRVYGYIPRTNGYRIEIMSLAIGMFKHRVLNMPLGRRDGFEDPFRMGYGAR